MSYRKYEYDGLSEDALVHYMCQFSERALGARNEIRQDFPQGGPAERDGSGRNAIIFLRQLGGPQG